MLVLVLEGRNREVKDKIFFLPSVVDWVINHNSSAIWPCSALGEQSRFPHPRSWAVGNGSLLHAVIWPQLGLIRMGLSLEYFLAGRFSALTICAGLMALYGNMFLCSQLDVNSFILLKHTSQWLSCTRPAFCVSSPKGKGWVLSASWNGVSAVLAVGWIRWPWGTDGALVYSFFSCYKEMLDSTEPFVHAVCFQQIMHWSLPWVHLSAFELWVYSCYLLSLLTTQWNGEICWWPREY